MAREQLGEGVSAPTLFQVMRSFMRHLLINVLIISTGCNYTFPQIIKSSFRDYDEGNNLAFCNTYVYIM